VGVGSRVGRRVGRRVEEDEDVESSGRVVDVL